ncbi:hypothetical protein ACFVFH_28240 [Streptomyces sp. NPDC057697]|uniref:hypothetical protein n=1 Tax=Streptomyces sp. NPDC057697 TaxID=3346219 RepID=UPI0036CBF7A9
MHLLSSPSLYGWRWAAGQEKPLPQESEVGTPEHLAFEHLDPVDVSFNDSGVPGRGEASDDGIAVTFDTGSAGVEDRKTVLPDGIQPLWQPFALLLGEHLGGGLDVSGENFEVGAVDQNGLESKVVDLWERLGAAEDPTHGVRAAEL